MDLIHSSSAIFLVALLAACLCSVVNAVDYYKVTIRSANGGGQRVSLEVFRMLSFMVTSIISLPKSDTFLFHSPADT